MKTYKLFSEFCNATIYGETLADALIRAKTLPTPVRYENYSPVPGTGTTVTIGIILGIEDATNHSRETQKFEAVVAEVDGRPYRIFAVPGK